MRTKILGAFIAICMSVAQMQAQQKYVYTIDLAAVKDDLVDIKLDVPAVKKPTIVFHFPKIIPGTYRISDYGRFVSELSAVDKKGKALPVKRLSDNSWEIKNATQLATIKYKVEDTYDSKITHDIYSMAGTNIDEGKNFVVNPPGFFGYLEGMKELPFQLHFRKPQGFYAATPLKPQMSSDTYDVFMLDNVDHLYDSPIMFSLPDTATVKLGTSEVLIAVYSPKKQVQAKFVAQLLGNVLAASTRYLGGRLPVDKYAFILYFESNPRPSMIPGALEHNYSSFYCLPEAPQQALAPTIMDIGAHEFFHVITPLTIGSQEVKRFNFSQAILSKHLWLYEGSTEYASDHVQVKYGLNTVNQFLDKLSGKIKISREKYSDTLPFTIMSKQVADKYRDEYGNVYEKGALISACLDIYLLHLSAGTYDLVKLKHDLSIRYGKKTPFNDSELFDVIAELSFPETRDFFRKYVEGNQPLPYDYFFGLAGVKYSPVKVSSDYSLGGISMGATQEGKVVIFDDSKINDFGRKMGYKKLDQIISINDMKMTPTEVPQVLAKVKAGLKDGAPVNVLVVRNKDTLLLKGLAEKVEIRELHKLELMNDANSSQAAVRRGWLAPADKGVALQGDKKDVAEIDGIITALYDVISGPAGTRNWERFRSLFTPGAFMGATVPAGGGATKFITFTPEEYVSKNGTTFQQESFMEKELGRTINQFGSVAQVFTSYEFDLGNGKVKQRGINSVQLVREQGRWWIASIVWQEENPSLPIPQQYLK
jgi:predicted metalloprotease with PDZ domain